MPRTRIEPGPLEPRAERPRLLDVSSVTALHPGIKIGTLREWILHAESNGLHRALRKVGSKLLIVESELLDWIDERAEAGRHRTNL